MVQVGIFYSGWLLQDYGRWKGGEQGAIITLTSTPSLSIAGKRYRNVLMTNLDQYYLKEQLFIQ